MRPEEIAALGDLAGDAAAGLTMRVRELHVGIAQRAFGGAGAAARPAKVAHDAIADGAYLAARGLSRLLVRGGARAVSVVRAPDAPALETHPAGHLAVGALNGAFGDLLHRRGSPLAVPMAVRRGGRDVPCRRDALVAAFPDAGPRLAVFAHGLCETDASWRLGAERHVPYGARLETELGYTPVYVRYNTGRHISENGRDLAGLLGELVDAWPVEVSEVALVGHSMGGLLARSACHYGRGEVWTERVRHIFSLGSPHKGAPLEQAAYVACAALSKLPETRPLAGMINARSAGVKDLGRGYLVDADWRHEETVGPLRTMGSEVPFLPGANHYFISATLTREPDAPVGRVLGDLLVLRPSAWDHGGRGERLRFPIDNYRHIGAANHFDLLNHPAVYAQIAGWLGGRPALPAGSAPVAIAAED